jgi:DNA-binding MarR family transcriptional regulator
VNLALNYGKRLAELNNLLKQHRLSEPQYNVLRILRGAGEKGLPCQRIAERMLTRLPDITRMLDRLEKAGWVERQRSTEDRRVINVMIRQRGKELLSQLDQPVLQLHSRQFQNLEPVELTELNRLLSKSLKASA